MRCAAKPPDAACACTGRRVQSHRLRQPLLQRSRSLRQLGAFQSKESPYFSWFDFHNWPNEYGSWWGIYTLPQVNESDGSYQDYIIEDEDSVVRRWLRLGASGWRLDVADEQPDSFIRKLNAAARREKSDALIIGEVWRMRPTKSRTPSADAISRAANWIRL